MRCLRALVATCLLLLLPAAALADDRPDGFVKSLTNAALVVGKAGDKDANRHQALERLVTDGFDLTRISGRVLGPHWASASAAERAAFRGALTDYLVLTYAKRMGSTADATVTVLDSQQAGDVWTVRSAIAEGRERAYAVNWLVHRDDGRWRVLDITVDGISMAATYRDQFVAVIRANGGRIAALTSTLERKNRSLAQ